MKRNTVYTELTGSRLLQTPLLNRGIAFTEEQRTLFHLYGLLPPHVKSFEDQVKHIYQVYQQKDTPLEKHIYLRALQDRNEVLFYRFISEHIDEILPIIYTPVVGEACQRFSLLYRCARGLFIAYPHRDRIEDMLRNAPIDEVKVIVVTDGERILGLGDQGAGGMGIPIGKLSLYVACGGINPATTLPILLDVGTNNKDLLDDPGYIGWKHQRISGDDYFEFVDQFVQAVKKVYPNVLLQFEDFAQKHAGPLLNKYRDQLCCFNDDIQGTAAVTVAAILSAVKASGSSLADQRIVVVGAGSAGCGIGHQLVRAMQSQGISEQQAQDKFYLVDRDGLLHDQLKNTLPFQQDFLQPFDKIKDWGNAAGMIGLAEVVTQAKPTILLGVSGQPNLFTQEIVRSMAKHCQRPIILPLSNPTSRVEGKPEDLIQWTQGQALIATGSPFTPIDFNGEQYPIAQCNNCYIFPGMGLAILAAGITRVTDEMFMEATQALAELAPAHRDGKGALLPELTEITNVSKAIALRVAKKAIEQGFANVAADADIEQLVEQQYWVPQYPNLQPSV